MTVRRDSFILSLIAITAIVAAAAITALAISDWNVSRDNNASTTANPSLFPT